MSQIACSEQKQIISAERAVLLINAMIDQMVNEAGGHVKEVIEKLLRVGFTEEDLVEVFQFQKFDVAECLDSTDVREEVE